jgi:hypothetical protein
MVKYTEVKNQEQIKNALINNIIELEFLKADGSIRKMNATLKESIVPHVEASTDRKINPDTQVVWDTELNGWRSFRWDRLQRIKETS